MERFVVSARKYRPDNFRSVVGQEHITSTLVNAIARGQLSHAYLFCGPRGVGKTTCARIIAKAINCLNPTASHEACGECASCRAFAENASFNIYELDAASNNSVDNIRSLTEQVRIPPQVGKYAIYIIDEVHMLTTAAFNAFLKTLEEPPSYVIFILATTEKHKILPTILSRCQIYEFKHIGIEDVVGYLKYIAQQESITHDTESLYIIAQKADGCMRDALSMFDKVTTFCNSDLTVKGVSSALNILDYDTYFSFIDHLRGGDYQSSLLAFDSVLKMGFDAQTFLSGLSRHLRDVLVARNPTTLPLLGVHGTLAERYQRQGAESAVGFLFTAIDMINSAENSIKYSLNQRLVVELALMKICNLSVAIVAPVAQQPQVIVAPSAPVAPQSLIVTSPVAEVKSDQAIEKNVEATVAEVKTPEIQNPKEVKPVVERKSSLGLPRLNSMTSKKEDVVVTDKQQVEVDIENFTISDGDRDTVLNGCRIFAGKIAERNPRIALAFMDARVENGLLLVPVPNKILCDEIYAKKSQTCDYLSKCSGVMIYNFTVVVEQAPIEEKKILLRDDDKYKHLLDENNKLHEMTERLGLEFKA